MASISSTGAPHPAAALVGVAIAALAVVLAVETGADELLIGELLTGGLCALIVLVGALVGGGKTGRMAITTFLLPGLAFGGRAQRSGLAGALAAEMAPLARAWVAGAVLIGGGLLLVAKPVVAALVIAQPVFHRDPKNPMGPSRTEMVRVALGYFEGGHKGFVIGGGVLLALGVLVLAVRRRA